MVGGLFRLFLIFLCIPITHALIISEIMYDPPGSDTDTEWIEIFNNESLIDITSLRFTESNTNHLIKLYQGNPILGEDEYAVIADDAETFLAIFPNYNNTLFESSFSLSNTGETISIKDINNNNIVYDEITYSNDLGASENNFSLSRINETFQESFLTPGSENKFRETCDWQVTINTTPFSTNDEFEFKIIILKNKGNAANLTLLRVIEDQDGEIKKEYAPLKKSYGDNNKKETITLSPSLDEGQPFLISAFLRNLTCDDTDLSNNDAQELVFITKTSASSSDESESTISIEDVLENDIEFGQTIRVKLQIYKGDTSKYAIKLYAKNGKGKISTENSIHVRDKFTNYDLTVPLQLKSNCDGKYKDGEYTVIAEGLDTKDEFDIDVKGITEENCGQTTKATGKKSSSIEIIEIPESIDVKDNLEIKIKIINGDSEKHSYEAYSYVYRGSKSYSGDRKENLEIITLNPKEEKNIVLKNNLEITESGVYKVKAVLKQDDLKTEKESTKEFSVIGTSEESFSEKSRTNNPDVEDLELAGISKEENEAYLNNPTIYESNSEKIQKILPMFIIVVSIVVNIILIMGRER